MAARRRRLWRRMRLTALPAPRCRARAWMRTAETLALAYQDMATRMRAVF